MTIDKRAVMKKAWENYRRNNELIQKYTVGLNKGAVKFEWVQKKGPYADLSCQIITQICDG